MSEHDRRTRIVRAGRPHTGWVNVPVTRGSTFVFPTVEAWRDTRVRRDTERLPSYGARGTDSTHALEDMLCELEGGDRCALFPTGQAAIAVTMLAFLAPGDHVLITDGVYEPVRNFCKNYLSRLNIDFDFYDPAGKDLLPKIRPTTRMIYVESPASVTYDMIDLPAISAVVAERNIVIVADNTWGSGWLHRPLTLGADISIIAVTKYISGHSDVMMGAAISNTRAWPALQTATTGFGQTVGADDAYLALRGVRSMPARLAIHGAHAIRIARWLSEREEICKVFCPALESDASHQLWLRDCTGQNGLISVEFKKEYSIQSIENMIDALELFGIGASWGGFESLVLLSNLADSRTLEQWTTRGAIVRFHIGLEDCDDLLADLAQGLAKLDTCK